MERLKFYASLEERHADWWRETRTEALAEAQADAVEGGTELVKWRAGLGSDVPDSRAVQVHHEAVAVGVVGDADDFLLREDCAVERVLEFDNRRWATFYEMSVQSLGRESWNYRVTRTCESPDRERRVLVRPQGSGGGLWKFR